MSTRNVSVVGVLAGAVAALCLWGCAQSEADPACLGSSATPLAKACASASVLVQGVDVSKWQASIDWKQVKAQGYEFAFIRASDGLNYPDGQFSANWKGAKAAGVLRGAYQFFRPSQDPIAQADLLLDKLAQAGWIETGDLPVVIDIEVSEGQSNTTLRNRALSWIKYVEAKTGKKPIVYTSAGWSSVLGSALAAYPLWIANYTGTYSGYCPLMPDGWQTWLFWQYTSKGPVAGVGSKDVDKNVFDGDLAALKAFATSGTVPPPQPGTDAGADPCAAASSGNGAYCGSSLGGDPNALYNCQGGVTATKTSCANGCAVMPPGQADQCAAAGGDPCANASSGNGPYCGKTLGGDPNTLYNCQGATTASQQLCSSGCVLNPPGTADECAASAPPPGSGGNSGSAGSAGSAGQNPGGATGSGGSQWTDGGGVTPGAGAGSGGASGKGC